MQGFALTMTRSNSVSQGYARQARRKNRAAAVRLLIPSVLLTVSFLGSVQSGPDLLVPAIDDESAAWTAPPIASVNHAEHRHLVTGRRYQIRRGETSLTGGQDHRPEDLLLALAGVFRFQDWELMADRLALESETFKNMEEVRFTGECAIVLVSESSAGMDPQRLLAYFDVDSRNTRLLAGVGHEWKDHTRDGEYDFRGIAVDGTSRAHFRAFRGDEILFCDEWHEPIEHTYNGNVILPPQRLSMETWLLSFLRDNPKYLRLQLAGGTIDVYRAALQDGTVSTLYMDATATPPTWAAEIALRPRGGMAVFSLCRSGEEGFLYFQAGIVDYETAGLRGLNFVTVAKLNASEVPLEDARNELTSKLRGVAAEHYSGRVKFCDEDMPEPDPPAMPGALPAGNSAQEETRFNLSAIRLAVAGIGVLLILGALLMRRNKIA